MISGLDPSKKMPNSAKNLRDTTINIRAKSGERDLIDRAVRALGKNRSDFMLEAACREAKNVLLDRCYFSLDKKEYEEFLDALDRSPKANPKLKKTLTTPAPWE